MTKQNISETPVYLCTAEGYAFSSPHHTSQVNLPNDEFCSLVLPPARMETIFNVLVQN